MNAIALKSSSFLPEYFSTITTFSSQSKIVEQNTENLKVSEEKLVESVKSFMEFINNNIDMFLEYDSEAAKESYSINDKLINEIHKTIETTPNNALIQASKPLLNKLIEINKVLEVISNNEEVNENSDDYKAFMDDFIQKSINSGFTSTYK